MADDIDNNLPINIDGLDFSIGTDVYQNNGVTAHAQVVKIAWGDDETVTRATAGTPLPVQVYGITGNTPIITVTGSVRGLGNFGITNTAATPIYVTGGVAAYVYGITGATPVAVTGSVNILSDVGITGIVNVTGGRRLDQSIDSILIGGTAARNWNLTSQDVVRVLGADAGTYVPARIVGASGGTEWATIGACGDALKVAIVNTGFSASITFGAVVSVQNNGGDALRIQGTANGTPINVQFPVIPDVNIANTDSVFLVNTPPSSAYPPENFSLQNQQLYYGFDRSSPHWGAMNNLERLLLGAKPTTNVYHTVGQWLGYIWELETNINSRLNNIYSLLGGSGVQVRTSVQEASSVANPIIVRNRTTNIRVTAFTSTFSSGIMYINNATSESPYSILLINSSTLFNLITPTALFSIDTSNPANIFFNYLGDNVINGSTEHADANGFIRKPYYLGYRLAPQEKVILPFRFDHAILVTKNPDDEIPFRGISSPELDLTIIS